MKTTLLFLSVFLSVSLFGQYTDTPDSNFEQALIDLGYDSGNPNGWVPTANIVDIDSLDLSISNIADLEGIQDFISLEFLDCSTNNLTSINLNSLTNLKYFNCRNNGYLDFIDLSSNVVLETLNAEGCNLSMLDISGNNFIQHLNLNSNYGFSQLIGLAELVNLEVFLFSDIDFPGFLDLSYNPNLKHLNIFNLSLDSIDISQNLNLEYLNCRYNPFTSLNISNNTQLKDLRLQGGGQEPYTVDLSNLENLENLFIHGDGIILSSLDLNHCTNLKRVNISGTQMTSIDIIDCEFLHNLSISFNQLSSLDVSQSLNLDTLWCSNNNLTELDCHSNLNLKSFFCSDNDLMCLNFKNGNNINLMPWDFIANNNPQLYCIEVDDPSWSTSNWTSPDNVDLMVIFNSNCNNACSSSTVGLTDFFYDKNLIQILDLMGRETSFKPNTPLIYVYDDGSIEKVFTIE